MRTPARSIHTTTEAHHPLSARESHADRADRPALGQQVAARFDPPGLAFFRLGSSRLLLDRNAPSSLIYLAVDDVDASVTELRGKGVEITTEPHIIFQHTDDTLGPAGEDEWMAFITDSEGNAVGLVSYATTDPSSR